MHEELVKALRYCDLVVNKTEDTLQCGVCPYFERCSDLDNQAADALEAQTAQLAAKDAEIERLKMLAERALNHEQCAVKCICDVETYLELGAPKYIKRVIDKWRTPAKQDEEENR